MSASPIAGNESFTNVVYQAGVVNQNQIYLQLLIWKMRL